MFGNGYVWGMHWLGWIFWAVLVALSVLVFVRLVPRRPVSRPSPSEELKRRLTKGEMSSSEYQKRKTGLKS